MTQEDGEWPPETLDGLSLDDAVDVVVARDESLDSERVRETLAVVTDEDGVVRRDAVRSSLGDLSKIVSTPETRAELAAIALSDAQEAADPVAHLDVVQARLDGFETRLAAVEARVDDLGDDLQSLVADDGSGLYDVAADVRELTTVANRTQQAADELQVDIEAFERWVGDAAVRYDEFDEELDALDDSLSDLSATVDAVTDALASGDDPPVERDPAAAWVDTSFRHRAVGLLIDDLRHELATLRAWPGAAETERADHLAASLDDLHERWRTVGDRLDGVAPDDRFAERLSAFESALAEFEPPVDWNEVQATLDDHRSGVDGLA